MYNTLLKPIKPRTVDIYVMERKSGLHISSRLVFLSALHAQLLVFGKAPPSAIRMTTFLKLMSDTNCAVVNMCKVFL